MNTWKAIATAVAVVLALIIAVQPLYVLGLTILDYGHTPDGPYYTSQTKVTNRFPENDPGRLSALTAHAANPAGADNESVNAVRVPTDDWRTALAATRLRSTMDAVLLFGNATAPGAANASNVTNITLPSGSSAEAAAAIATMGNGTDDISPNNVIIVSSENPQWALPAAAWSAYSGDPILYADSDGVPQATTDAIQELNASHAYVLAPESLVGEEALSELDVSWTRVAGRTPQQHAVEVAEYRDESREFGWGFTDRTGMDIANPSKYGFYNYMLVNPGQWEHGVASANLQWGKAGPILLMNPDGSLPVVTENHIWRTKPDYFVTPAEGAYNHLFVMGTQDAVSWVAQGRTDYSSQISSYLMKGDAMSALEALVSVWAVFSLFGATFVFAHSRHRFRKMGHWTRLFWPLFTLLLGPVGFGLYWIAYRGRSVVDTSMGRRVARPYWLQSATATAMSVAFAASTMIATSWLIFYSGLPLLMLEGPLFWLGSPMILLMIIIYVVAFLVSWLVFHVPMLRDMSGIDTRTAVRRGLLAVAVSMTSVSIGMMAFMYWQMMLHLPGMPDEENILWFGVMVFGTLIGFLIAWPINGILVRKNVKSGGAL